MKWELRVSRKVKQVSCCWDGYHPWKKKIFEYFFLLSSFKQQNNSSFFIPQFITIIYIFSSHRYYYCLSIFYLPYFSYCSLFYFMNLWIVVNDFTHEKLFLFMLPKIIILYTLKWNWIYLTTLKLDQNNSAFNIHHIPSSVSLETPSERSASVEPSNHEQKSCLTLNLPNGNLPNSRKTSFSSMPATIVTIPDDHEPLTLPSQSQQEPQSSSRKLSKLSIIDPIDSICWRYDDLLAISVVKHFIHLILFKEVI